MSSPRGQEYALRTGIHAINENGFPNFTNEVQHLIMVLLWEQNILKSELKSGVKLPVFTGMTL